MIRSSFIFKEHHVFIEEEDNPSDKVVIVEEELDGTGNLVDLSKLMFIDEECGNLKVGVDGGELTRNNNRKKKSKFYKSVDIHSETNVIDEIKVSMIFLLVHFFGG